MNNKDASFLVLFLAPVKDYLADDQVSEILINGPNQIFIERGDPLPIVVSDYISGMTDQYAIQKYEEYFVPKGWTD